MSQVVLFVILLMHSILISPGVTHAHQISGKIFVDDLYEVEHLKILKNDVKALLEFPLEKANSDTLRELTGTSNASSKETLEWLERWVHFIYPSSFTDISRIYIASKSKPKESACGLFQQDGSAKVALGSTRGKAGAFHSSVADQFLMYHLGLSKFSFIQHLSYTLGAVFLHDHGVYKIDIKAPTVGIVVTGHEFFNPDSYLGGENKNDIDSLAFSLFRVSTLLHEAAHSRGRDQYLGFAHVKCPSTVEAYAGAVVCDEQRNGGNGIKAAFLEAIINACRTLVSEGSHGPFPMCTSSASLEFLSQNLKDVRTRIISDEVWDETPVLPGLNVPRMMNKVGEF